MTFFGEGAISMELPCVRFIRIYDVQNHRMATIWQRVKTQEQLENWPRATELTVTSQTVEEAMIDIRKMVEAWKLGSEVLREIEEASKSLVDAQYSVYEAAR